MLGLGAKTKFVGGSYKAYIVRELHDTKLTKITKFQTISKKFTINEPKIPFP